MTYSHNQLIRQLAASGVSHPENDAEDKQQPAEMSAGTVMTNNASNLATVDTSGCIFRV